MHTYVQRTADLGRDAAAAAATSDLLGDGEDRSETPADYET